MGLLSGPGIPKACNFCWKMTYGTHLLSLLMIASLSLTRMNIFHNLRRLVVNFPPFLPPVQSSQERSRAVSSPSLLLNRLIASLMALYSRCVLSLAIPMEGCSFLGPSAKLNAHQNDFHPSPSRRMVYKLSMALWEECDVTADTARLSAPNNVGVLFTHHC